MTSFLKLVVTEGPGTGEEFLVQKTGARIGTDPECEIVLRGESISPVHCRVIPSEGQWIVEDLESATGTFVNDDAVELRALEEGDVIRIGETRLAVAELNAGPAGPPQGVSESAGDTAPAFPRSTGEWHYHDGEREQGPYELVTLKGFVWDRAVTRTTRVRKEGMEEWMSAEQIPDLRESVYLQRRAAVSDITAAWRRRARPERMGLGLFLAIISAIAALRGTAVWLEAVHHYEYSGAAEFAWMSSGVLLLISLAVWGMLHYRCWAVLPEHAARTTPGKAVGFLFIPLFQFLWAFLTFPSLVSDLKKYARVNHIPLRRFVPGMGILMAVGFCLATLAQGDPNVGTAVGLVYFAVVVLYYVSVAGAAKTIGLWRIENHV